jgi:hypothetical protein
MRRDTLLPAYRTKPTFVMGSSIFGNYLEIQWALDRKRVDTPVVFVSDKE